MTFIRYFFFFTYALYTSRYLKGRPGRLPPVGVTQTFRDKHSDRKGICRHLYNGNVR